MHLKYLLEISVIEAPFCYVHYYFDTNLINDATDNTGICLSVCYVFVIVCVC